ncbi:unnamed protein product [Plutella xylostella]|uniref:(diamondback moth) hypothetical protein n=1 Tax=Plutella xylostella TaxID=51655 RepID=A0A8S4G4K9_PLUXY|nr:unnamed protein product [Plutella xylostella]
MALEGAGVEPTSLEYMEDPYFLAPDDDSTPSFDVAVDELEEELGWAPAPPPPPPAPGATRTTGARCRTSSTPRCASRPSSTWTTAAAASGYSRRKCAKFELPFRTYPSRILPKFRATRTINGF